MGVHIQYRSNLKKIIFDPKLVKFVAANTADRRLVVRCISYSGLLVTGKAQ